MVFGQRLFVAGQVHQPAIVVQDRLGAGLEHRHFAFAGKITWKSRDASLNPTHDPERGFRRRKVARQGVLAGGVTPGS